jgi:hypothetical protein
LKSNVEVNVRMWKIVGIAALSLVLALAAGWAWGASGRLDLQRRYDALSLRCQLTEARAHLLAARVDLYTLNFGSATQHFEAAKVPLDAARLMLQQQGHEQAASGLQTSLGAAEDGRRLAAQVNPSAQASADKALKALGDATAAAER